MWVVYHAQGQEGESESAPNVFEVPAPKAGEPSEQEDYARDEETVRRCVKALRQHHLTRLREKRAARGSGPGTRPLFLYCDVDYPHGPYWRDMPAAAPAEDAEVVADQ